VFSRLDVSNGRWLGFLRVKRSRELAHFLRPANCWLPFFICDYTVGFFGFSVSYQTWHLYYICRLSITAFLLAGFNSSGTLDKQPIGEPYIPPLQAGRVSAASACVPPSYVPLRLLLSVPSRSLVTNDLKFRWDNPDSWISTTAYLEIAARGGCCEAKKKLKCYAIDVLGRCKLHITRCPLMFWILRLGGRRC